MPKIETSYGSLFYSDIDQSKKITSPLILLHGAIANHLIWSGDFRRMEGQRVISLDLLGHGRSEGDVPETIQTHVESVIAFMDALEIKKGVFAGHSMGGAIAQQLALSYPARCAGLVLIATGAKLPVNPDILNLVHTDKAKVVGMVNKWEWSPSAPLELKQRAYERALEVPAEQMYRDYAACNQFDVVDRLGEITAPTLVISAALDKMAPPAWQDVLAQTIPNAIQYRVEDAGHYLILESPQEIVAAIQRWLSELTN